MYGPPRPPDRGPVQTLLRPRRRRPLTPAVQRTVTAPPPPTAPMVSPLDQAKGLVSQQIDPILRQITEMYNRRAGDMSGAIGGITGQYQSNLSQYAGMVPAHFATALGIVKNTGQGLNDELTGLGAAQGGVQAAATSAVGLPANAGGSDIDLAGLGAGAGSTAGAIGQAMLDQLRAEQASAEGYAGKLPGFAGLEGQQNTRDVLSILAQRLSEDLSSETARAPSLLYSIYQDLLGNQRADRDFAFQQRQYNDQERQRKAGIKGATAPTLAGRKAYWDDQAAIRSEATGDLWIGTNTGIRPYDADPRKAGIQKVRTSQGIGGDWLNAQRKSSAQANEARADATTRNAATSERRAATGEKNADTAARRAATAERAEEARHAEAVRRLNISAKSAKTSAQQAALTKARDAETRRHNRANEQIARSKKKTSGGGTFDPATGKYG